MMRRDLGGELLVAVAVVAVLVFALIFGIVVTLSNQTPSATQATTAAQVTGLPPIAADTQEIVPTLISLTPTAGDAAVSAPDATATLSDEATHTAAPIPATIIIVSNATLTARQETVVAVLPPSSTPTVAPSSTPSNTATNPATTPASTNTVTQTATVTPTSTPVTPSLAATFTASPTASATATLTASATASATATLTPSLTPTLTATATATATPTLTSTSTPTPVTPTAEPPCVPSATGIDYTVPPNTSLYAIARSVGTSVWALRRLNCLPVDQAITEGQTLRVPNAPQIAAATTIPLLPPADQVYLAQGCSLGTDLISEPLPGDPISGLIEIIGSAGGAGFASYRLEIRPASRDVYDLYARSTTPVNEGRIARLNTVDYDQGLHYIRLSILNISDQVLQSCVIPVIFQ